VHLPQPRGWGNAPRNNHTWCPPSKRVGSEYIALYRKSNPARILPSTRAIPSGRAHYGRGDRWRFGTVHHETDRSPQCADGTEVYPGWKFVQGGQHGEVGASPE